MPARKDRLTATPDIRRRRLATVSELAEYLGVPVQTVYGWNTKGTGPKAIKAGRYVRYRWDDIERWLDGGGHKSVTG
jgi:excisionase family DNA binding protein